MTTNNTELGSFLRLESYYRRFIYNFAEIAAVVNVAKSGNRSLKWKAEDARRLRRTTYQVDFSASTGLTGLRAKLSLLRPMLGLSQSGAIIAQKREYGKIHPIQYESRTMNTAGRKKSVFEREALSVILVLKKFHVYLIFLKPFVLHKRLGICLKTGPVAVC